MNFTDDALSKFVVMMATLKFPPTDIKAYRNGIKLVLVHEAAECTDKDLAKAAALIMRDLEEAPRQSVILRRVQEAIALRKIEEARLAENELIVAKTASGGEVFAKRSLVDENGYYVGSDAPAIAARQGQKALSDGQPAGSARGERIMRALGFTREQGAQKEDPGGFATTPGLGEQDAE